MSFLSQPLDLMSILFGPKRSFGDISGYVTIGESATDALEITQQPVQQGASIADHAFKKPVSFSAQILFASSLAESLSDIYAKLLALQSSRTPFTVVTPTRTFYNMLFAALGKTTEKKTENILAINVTFQEVIIVPVSTTIVPRSQLKNAGANGGTKNAGKKSALLSLSQGVGGVFK